eukprot:CAMPEP_0202910912 /NCGR_PEP_ID=MMETSP1392-20130828/53427_1 /ASSEMBLY_ACC=CAM_ASM_000868 /TAXON_ID=225041 /ORGANISM="Chlamydomonas chlamydogama, Strain SAG 11-48b" /LENGTH=92 /DNA_ID=CAMNT_0049601195 /DNA_START=62 /DNA_END=337 /DNA_ORIENTATION=+
MDLTFFFSLLRITPAQATAAAQHGQRKGFNYAHQGCTKDGPIALKRPNGIGWVVGHKRVKVGEGRQAYEGAVRLLRRWGHFQLPWASVQAST